MNEITLNEAIEKHGGLSEVARRVGVSAQTLSNWRARLPPEEHCPSLERSLMGDCTCEAMRPDVSWVRIKDKDWPHPKGRPLVDHTMKVGAGDTAKEAA